MENICKSFPGVKALDGVELELHAGEVLALLGENGAGKSTLLKILSGAYKRDAGDIYIDGQKADIRSPNDAYGAGIRIIYQELTYIEDLTVAENIFLGNLFFTKLGFVDWKRMNREAKAVLERIGLDIDATRTMGSLSVMEKQLVEVAKAVSKNMRILVMDEPTSSLNEREVEGLARIIRDVAGKGIGIIFISHRLEELFMVADRVTVLRDGRHIATKPMGEVTRDQLVSMMAGRETKELYVKKQYLTAKQIEDRPVVFEAVGVSGNRIQDITLRVHAGEITGVYGLLGSGREEMAETFFGIHRYTSGSLKMNGREIRVTCPRDAIANGIAYVPAERKSESLVLSQTVRENTSLASLAELAGRWGIMRKSQEKEISRKWMKRLDIRTPDEEAVIEGLSGGNQQKVVLGRWMERGPRLMLLNDPTRGVDVGAKSEIYRIIEELCQTDTAIVMISSDMEELLALSDRIIAMSEGRICGEVSHEELNRQKLMGLVVGGSNAENKEK